jgi:phage shock protein C
MRKLYRSTTNSRITGLCGGLADYLGVSAGLLRFITVIAAFCSFGTTLLVYFIASMLTPKQPSYFHHSNYHYY